MEKLTETSGFHYIHKEKTFDVSSLVTVYIFDHNPHPERYWELYDFSQIFLVLEGSGTYITQEASYPIESGMMFYRPAGRRSSYEWSTEKVRFVLISFVCNSPAMETIGVKPVYLHEEEIVTLLDVIKTAYKVCEPLKEDDKLLGMQVKANVPGAVMSFIYASLERFLCMLYCRLEHIGFLTQEDQKVNRHLDDSRLIKEIKKYLSEHVCEQLSVRDICNNFGISQTALTTKFRKEVQQGIMEYFTDLKVEAAKEKIRAGEKRFTEIAEELGFSSVNYFSRVFKNRTHITPTEYSKYVSKRNVTKNLKEM